MSHNFLAITSSYDSVDEFATFFLMKYFPVTFSTSGDVAKKIEVSAPLRSLLKDFEDIGCSTCVIDPILVSRTPGCKQFTVTFVCFSLLASS